MNRQIDSSTIAPGAKHGNGESGLGQAFVIWVAAITLVVLFSLGAIGKAHSAERVAVLSMSQAISEASAQTADAAVDAIHTGSVPHRTVHGIRALEKHDVALLGIAALFVAMSAGLYRLWRSTIAGMTGPRGTPRY